MKDYFAYTRVSTVRQGEKGSSLQEQRSAIDAYARRHAFAIGQWFEEQETAAKRGRPIFLRMLRALEKGRAAGVITHKIDRSARNLRDWAALGELVDRGVELHFAHESIDLSSRGGRLSADIQAVVAADYVRNLREEVRKGFYGRLKQGLYPLRAPIGYLDQGGGRPKTIDPVIGPLITKAFELYASGSWTLDTLRNEMHDRGVRNKMGGRVSRDGWSTILNNPFYIGLIRIKKVGETFRGVHEPLIGAATFSAVQAILTGKVRHRGSCHRFRYQRLIRCSACDCALVAERQKGHVYYRCHTPECRGTSLREEPIDKALRESVRPFQLSDEQWAAIQTDIDAILDDHKTDAANELRATSIAVAKADSRLDGLTDAFLDRLIEKDAYLQRKERLLHERAGLLHRRLAIEHGNDGSRQKVDQILELIKTLRFQDILANDEKTRETLKIVTSNLTASGKNIAIAWRNPFRQLANLPSVSLCGPYPASPRTESVRMMSRIIIEHCEQSVPVDKERL